MSLRLPLLLLLLPLALGVARAEAPAESPSVVTAPTPPTPTPPPPMAPTPPAPPPTPAPELQYECTSFPVRSTMAMGAFQAPADVSNARLNTTRLPVGWTPMAGSVGEGGAFVVACKAFGS